MARVLQQPSSFLHAAWLRKRSVHLYLLALVGRLSNAGRLRHVDTVQLPTFLCMLC